MTYPPKNRTKPGLPLLVIQVEDAAGVHNFTPNHIAMRSMDAAWWDKLQPCGATSLLSGAPACLYRSDDFEIPLTGPEICRLARLALRPKEYFRLRAHFGMAHEWHEDFYDPETGGALQARWLEGDKDQYITVQRAVIETAEELLQKIHTWDGPDEQSRAALVRHIQQLLAL